MNLVTRLSVAMALLTFAFASDRAAAVMIFTDSGATPGDISDTVNAFRAALGGANNGGTATNFADGRREINWDGAPDSVSDPNPFPGNFFNTGVSPRARGIEFTTDGDGFLLSATEASGQPIAFSMPNQFEPFSPERLFSAVNSNRTTAHFFLSADPTTAALSRGFGVVFTGNEADNSGIQLYGLNGNLLDGALAPVSGVGGLSFVGIVYDTPLISFVDIVSGTALLVANGHVVPGPEGNDIVVMDDFIYGEPQPVPVPGTLALLAASALATRRRAMRR